MERGNMCFRAQYGYHPSEARVEHPLSTNTAKVRSEKVELIGQREPFLISHAHPWPMTRVP
eukprot:7391617-Prymnesium_polylepis.1